MCFSPRHTIFTDKPRHTWLFISPITGNHRQIKISGVYDLESEQLNFSSADSVCTSVSASDRTPGCPTPDAMTWGMCRAQMSYIFTHVAYCIPGSFISPAWGGHRYHMLSSFSPNQPVFADDFSFWNRSNRWLDFGFVVWLCCPDSSKRKEVTNIDNTLGTIRFDFFHVWVFLIKLFYALVEIQHTQCPRWFTLQIRALWSQNYDTGT